MELNIYGVLWFVMLFFCFHPVFTWWLTISEASTACHLCWPQYGLHSRPICKVRTQEPQRPKGYIGSSSSSWPLTSDPEICEMMTEFTSEGSSSLVVAWDIPDIESESRHRHRFSLFLHKLIYKLNLYSWLCKRAVWGKSWCALNEAYYFLQKGNELMWCYA